MIRSAVITAGVGVLVVLVVVFEVVEDGISGEGTRQRLARAEEALRTIATLRADLRQTQDDLDSLTSSLAEAAATRDAASLDSHPFSQDLIASWIHFPDTDKERSALLLPATAPAPTGRAALKLSRSFNWPDEWNARHRPELFFLGPPNAKTSRLSACLRHAMGGDPKRHPYPLAETRWPQKIKGGAEPPIALAPALQNHRLWNRTGFRRWDAPKEWWVYPHLGRYGGLPAGYLQKGRFPPVEAASRNWVLIDATADQLMIPEAADAAAADLSGAPFTPSFTVMRSNVVERAYQHYLTFSKLRVKLGWPEETTLNFADKLDEQMRKLRNIGVCEMMLQRPHDLLQDMAKVRMALGSCLYDIEDEEQPMYLSFGFAALGLKYWAGQFPKGKFHVLSVPALDGMGPAELMAYLASTADLKAMHPRCDDAAHWRSPHCTGHLTYDNAVRQCSPEEPTAAEATLTNTAGKEYTRGSEAALKAHNLIGERWGLELSSVIAEMGAVEYVNHVVVKNGEGGGGGGGG